MYYVEVLEVPVTKKSCVGRLTVSPTGGRVTLKRKDDLDPLIAERLIVYAQHIQHNTNATMSLRGRITIRHNSLQAILASENKKEKESYVMDLSDGQVTTQSEFYRNRN